MNEILLHPSLPLIAGGLLTPMLPRRATKLTVCFSALLGLLSALSLPMGTAVYDSFINQFPLLVLKVDMLSWVMTLTAAFMMLCAGIYGWGRMERSEGACSLLYAGSACGALLAGDFVTLIFWFEAMAAAAAFMLWSQHEKRAVRAGFRYLMVHFFGGNLLLFGIILLISQGQFLLEPLPRGGAGYYLILSGLGIFAGMLPFHAWIPDAYPNASVTGSVIMSSMTTKVAVITLLRLFAGDQFLLWMGIAMAYWGVFYALRENNIRKLLSYHIISQLGLIIAAIGLGTPLACNAAAGLTIGNMVYKGLLFMSTGAIYACTGRQKLTELGGIGRLMPLTSAFFLIGALAISGVPGLMGFAVKPMVVTAATVSLRPVVELLLYAAGIGTFLSIPLKMGFYMLAGEAPFSLRQKPAPAMHIGMGFLAAVIIVVGIHPDLLYRYLPWTTFCECDLFTADHIISELQFLLAALAVFVLFHRLLKPKDALSLDFDWFYRIPLPRFFLALSVLLSRVGQRVWAYLTDTIKALCVFFANPVRFILPSNSKSHPEEYNCDAYRPPVGSGALVILIVFMLIFFYIMIF